MFLGKEKNKKPSSSSTPSLLSSHTLHTTQLCEQRVRRVKWCVLKMGGASCVCVGVRERKEGAVICHRQGQKKKKSKKKEFIFIFFFFPFYSSFNSVPAEEGKQAGKNYFDGHERKRKKRKERKESRRRVLGKLKEIKFSFFFSHFLSVDV